jgi:hypothetical protein
VRAVRSQHTRTHACGETWRHTHITHVNAPTSMHTPTHTHLPAYQIVQLSDAHRVVDGIEHRTELVERTTDTRMLGHILSCQHVLVCWVLPDALVVAAKKIQCACLCEQRHLRQGVSARSDHNKHARKHAHTSSLTCCVCMSARARASSSMRSASASEASSSPCDVACAMTCAMRDHTRART